MEPASYETVPQDISEKIKDENIDDALRDAFIDYVKKDNIGVISNALLFKSDLYGIESQALIKIK